VSNIKADFYFSCFIGKQLWRKFLLIEVTTSSATPP
jgi:hypothetical protein